MVTKQEHQSLNRTLPLNVCTQKKVPCGHRGEANSCRCPYCGYSVQTTGLSYESKQVMLSFLK